MRQRNAGVSRNCHGRTYPRDDLEGNPRAYQRFGFFSTPTKNKRIPAFEPHDHQAAFCVGNKELMNLLLRQAVISREFTGKDALGLWRRLFQEDGVYKAVIEDRKSTRLNSSHSQI